MSTSSEPNVVATTRTTSNETSGPSMEPLEVEDAPNTSTDPETNSPEYPSGVKFQALMAGLLCCCALGGLDISIVSTAIPSITNDFKTVADIGWYVAAYRLTSSAFQFLFGKFYSLFSIKKVFLASLAIFEVGSLICTVAPSSFTLVLGRAICGLGNAGLLAGTFTIIALTVPLRKRSIYGGLAGGIEGLASVSAPLLGGILTDKLSWRACFGINLPMGVLTFLLIYFSFENPRRDDSQNQSLSTREKVKKLDLPGAALLVPSVIFLLIAFQWGGTRYSWKSAPVISLLVLSVVFGVVFGYWQRRKGEDAMIPPRILKNRSMLAGAWFAFVTVAALTVVENYIIIYLQGVKGVSASKSGLLTVPMIVGLLVGCLTAGYGTSIVGYYSPFMVISTILGPIAAGLLTTTTTATISHYAHTPNHNHTSTNPSSSTSITTPGFPALLSYEALLGFGVGIGIQAPQVAAATIFPARDVALAIAVVQFGQGVGTAIAITIAQTIFTNRLTSDVGRYASGLTAKNLESMGLSDLKSHLGGDGERLEKVLLGYDRAVIQTLYLPVALISLAVVGTAGMEWRSVKRRRD